MVVSAARCGEPGWCGRTRVEADADTQTVARCCTPACDVVTMPTSTGSACPRFCAHGVRSGIAARIAGPTVEWHRSLPCSTTPRTFTVEDAQFVSSGCDPRAMFEARAPRRWNSPRAKEPTARGGSGSQTCRLPGADGNRLRYSARARSHRGEPCATRGAGTR